MSLGLHTSFGDNEGDLDRLETKAVELLVLTCNDVNPVCLNTAYLNDDSPKAALSCFFYDNHDF